jgi:hypothetical protein
MRRILLLVVLWLLPASIAAGETKADALFKKGKKLLAEKRYLEACGTFEQVDKLDPGIGAKLNVAKCYEEWGKLATAYTWYRDAEKMAKDTSDKRGDKITKLIEELDVDVPRLTIKLPDGTDMESAAVKLDGKPIAASVFGKEQRVDPGPHVIEYDVGDDTRTKNVPLERGGSREVTLDIPKGIAKKKPKPKEIVVENPPVTPPASPGRTRRIAGIAVGGAGVVAIGVASYLTLDARSTYKDALAAHCMGATNMCSDEGVQITNDARGRANIATVIGLVGVAAVAGGVYLYISAPKASGVEHAYLAPAVSGDGAGVVFGGGF